LYFNHFCIKVIPVKEQHGGYRFANSKRVRYLLGAGLLGAMILPSAAMVRVFQQGPATPPQQAPAQAQAEPPAAGVPAPALPSYLSKGKRDPFKSPFDKKKVEPKPEFDVPPPRNRRPPGPAGLLVNEAVLMGTVQGPTGKVALIGGDGSVTYFLKEGDRLYDGSISEITDSSIKFVREIKISSKVVDQQEVVKKISPAP
jgi:Tfp pilus assembly protein PilP